MSHEISIIIDGEQRREIDFQTLDDETAEIVNELLLMQVDNTLAVLNQIGNINIDEPPEVEILE